MGVSQIRSFFKQNDLDSVYLQSVLEQERKYQVAIEQQQEQVSVAGSNVEVLDLRQTTRLRRLFAMYCPELKVVGGFFPQSLESLDISCTAVDRVNIGQLCNLERFRGNFCHGLQFSSPALPEVLEELEIEQTQVGLVDFTHCMKLHILVATGAEKFRARNDFLPASLRELLVGKTLVQYLSAKQMAGLEKLEISDNFNFVLKDDFLPPGLRGLRACKESISNINIKGCKQLLYLDISQNINASYDTLPYVLEYLDLSKTSLKSVDLTEHIFLEYLNISDLFELQLKDNYLPRSLVELLAMNCQEFNLDKTNILELKRLVLLNISDTYCRDSNVRIIPKNLKELVAKGNSIKFLDLGNTSVQRLNINNNTGCEIRNMPDNILSLSVAGNSISELTMSLFPQLQILNMENNKDIRLINATLPPTLLYLNIRGTQIRNLDFTLVQNIELFYYDDEKYNFTNGILPQGLREFKTTKIAGLNVNATTSLQDLDFSDNEAIMQQYKGIYYKVSATIVNLRISRKSLQLLDLTEAAALRSITYDGNEGIQLRDGVIPPQLQEFKTRYIQFLDFSRSVGLKRLNIDDNAVMEKYYQEMNQQYPQHYLVLPSSVELLSAERESVQYFDFHSAGCLKYIFCNNNDKVWFKDGYVPESVVELRSSAVQYIDLSTAQRLEILDISNNKYITVKNGYVPSSLKELLFAFDQQVASLYSLTLKIQHCKELYFIDCTNNSNVNFDGDFVPSNVEIVKIQGCRLISKLNLIQAKNINMIKIDQELQLMNIPATLDIIEIGDITVEVIGFLKELLNYHNQIQQIVELQSRIGNYTLKKENFMEKQELHKSLSESQFK